MYSSKNLYSENSYFAKDQNDALLFIMKAEKLTQNIRIVLYLILHSEFMKDFDIIPLFKTLIHFYK